MEALQPPALAIFTIMVCNPGALHRRIFSIIFLKDINFLKNFLKFQNFF